MTPDPAFDGDTKRWLYEIREPVIEPSEVAVAEKQNRHAVVLP